MLKWTVSRSLSQASSTPHGPGGGGKITNRRPFRDLSNTPPTSSGTSRSSSNGEEKNEDNKTNNRRTPSKRRRCRSQGSDLRGYFQTTKPNHRQSKRQSLMQRNSNSPVIIDGFYQSTPRVDADIGPLTLYPTQQTTLPTDPQSLLIGSCFPSELPQNLVNDTRTSKLQSHVSDFIHQISMATSPEDVMESESLAFDKVRRYTCKDNRHTPYLPKLARISKLNARSKTPYHTKPKEDRRNNLDNDGKQLSLACKLLKMRLDHDKPKYESLNILGSEVLNREQEVNIGCKSVTDILSNDSSERRKVLESIPNPQEEDEEEHIYETISERAVDVLDDSRPAAHNDSSVSSASQLLENPSPLSWAFCSPNSDIEGEFPLKRQRVIRRKRQAKDINGGCSKKAKTDELPLVEAVNRHVKRLALETDLDLSMCDDMPKNAVDLDYKKFNIEDNHEMIIDKEMQDCETNNDSDHNLKIGMTSLSESKEENHHNFENQTDSLVSQSRCQALSGSNWDTESPKSSLLDSFATTMTTASITCTPEAPLVATVRRCLKYSPETPSEHSRNFSYNNSSTSRASIEIECSAHGDQIHVKIIRCRDLRRAYEGPIHAYVKASLKDPISGEGCVKRTAVHRPTPNPIFNENLILTLPQQSNNNWATKRLSLDIAVWHRDRRARRSELLGCMTLPLPLSQDKEATWHPLEASSGRTVSNVHQDSVRGSVVSPPMSKIESTDNNNGIVAQADDLTYLRHLELEPVDPHTGLPLHPGFAARGGRTPCTITRRLIRPASSINQVPWGFSLSWGRPPRVERVDPGSPAERSGLRPGDYVVFVEATNVVTLSRDDILELIQGATNQLTLEIYKRGGVSTMMTSSVQRQSVQHQSHQPVIAFTAEVGNGVLV